jgi:hypothetical protein
MSRSAISAADMPPSAERAWESAEEAAADDAAASRDARYDKKNSEQIKLIG